MSSKPRKRQDRVVRLSKTIIGYLKKRKSGNESFDSTLRRQFGIPSFKDRGDDNRNALRTFFLVRQEAGHFKVFDDLATARGEAILVAMRKGVRKAERVIETREVPE